MSTSQAAGTVAAGGEIDRSKNYAALRALLLYVSTKAQTNAKSIVDQAEQSLINASWRESESPDVRIKNHDAARWLSQNSQMIQAELNMRLMRDLTTVQQPKAVDFEELHMLEEGALDLIVERARIVNKVSERGGADVAHLEARLNTLQGTGFVFIAKALTPGHFADWFHNSLSEMKIPPEAFKHLIEVFSGLGVELMLDFYKGANRVLIQQGVLPDMKVANVKISHNHDPRLASHALNRRLERLDDVMSHLPLADWRPGHLRESIERFDSEAAPFAALSKAQGSEPEAPEEEVLSEAQIQSVDHVEAIFRDLLSDDNISVRMREELHKLIVPIVAIRLSGDPDSFAPVNSPVRVFVRQLALLGRRDFEAPLQDFESIKSIVGRIVAEHGKEIASFRSATDALYTLTKMEMQHRMSETTSNLLAKSTQDATTQVTIELNELAAGLKLPKAVQSYIIRLLGPWMIVRHVRYGAYSEQWEQARDSAASFFDALRPATTEKEHLRKRALRRLCIKIGREKTERSKLPKEEVQELVTKVEEYFNELDQMTFETHKKSNAIQVVNNLSHHQYLQRVWAQARREKRYLCLLRIEIDNFEEFSSCLSQAQIDNATHFITSLLEAEAKRPLDVIVRKSAAEFFGVWYDCEPVYFKQLVARLPKVVATFNSGESADKPALNVSGGAVITYPKTDEADGWERSIKRIDENLAHAHVNGGNQIIVTGPEKASIADPESRNTMVDEVKVASAQ